MENLTWEHLPFLLTMNNRQRCEHQLQAHNAANETYKNLQVIKTQTRYTQGTVWQEFCSSDSDNIGNNDSDNDI